MPVVVVGQPHQQPALPEGTHREEPSWDTVAWPVHTVLAETADAWRVQLDWPVGFTLWLPKSRCCIDAERWVTIPGWIAQERGLPATNTEYPD